MRRGVVCVPLLLSLVLGGCAGGQAARERLARLSASMAPLVLAGAKRCAPRELAEAEVQLDFARIELRQGNLERAEEHMDEAEANRGAARVLSPAARCGLESAGIRSVSRAGSNPSSGGG